MGLTKKTSDAVYAATGARPKMELADRAKIFIPFDPLKGFTQALRAKEAEMERSYEGTTAREINR